MLVPPLSPDDAREARLEKTPLIATLAELDAFPDAIAVSVLLKLGDDISTDHIIPAGARVMPYWSNIEKTAVFAFVPIDHTYARRAAAARDGRMIVAGNNYGQGSSRENAAFAPRYLGLRAVLARSFARIHGQNLSNFGVLPLTFADAADCERIGQDEVIRINGIHDLLHSGSHELHPRRLTSHRLDPSSTRAASCLTAGPEASIPVRALWLRLLAGAEKKVGRLGSAARRP